MILEDYSLLEAVYMAVISIATVGDGEVRPLSDGGKNFTMFLLLLGVGSLAFAAHAFIESMIERAPNPVREKKLMQKKIGCLEDHTEAMGNGVDVVVVKSPDAAEIVNHVAELIKVEEES